MLLTSLLLNLIGMEKNVIVQGGSQGGALAIVTAGLDKRVTACVANHPALSDMAGYKAGRAEDIRICSKTIKAWILPKNKYISLL